MLSCLIVLSVSSLFIVGLAFVVAPATAVTQPVRASDCLSDTQPATPAEGARG